MAKVDNQLKLFGLSDAVSVDKPRHRRAVPARAPQFLNALEGIDPQEEGFAKLVAQVHSGLCQTALPHYRLEDDSQPWERHGLAATLIVNPGTVRDSEGGKLRYAGVPYGSRARLILIYIQTMGVLSRTIPLGNSMSAWIRSLGLPVSGGPRGTIGEIKEQILRIANCTLTIETKLIENGGVQTTVEKAMIAKGLKLWADSAGREQWPTELLLDQDFYYHLRENAVALDKRAIATLSGHSLGLDVYASFAHWLPKIGAPMTMNWQQLVKAFGSNDEATFTFGKRLRKVMPIVREVYPEAKVEVCRNGLVLFPSKPPVSSKTQIGYDGGLRALPAPSAAAPKLVGLTPIAPKPKERKTMK